MFIRTRENLTFIELDRIEEDHLLSHSCIKKIQLKVGFCSGSFTVQAPGDHLHYQVLF